MTEAPAERPATAPPPAAARRLGRGTRVLCGAWLAVLVCGFALARWLEPSPAGLGTHQQLGLPPCTVRVVAGIPCPACGMTTSFAHFTRGQWPGSVRANAGGFALALICLAAVPVLAAAAWGRPVGPLARQRPEWWGVAALSTVGAIALIDWAHRLATGG